MTVGMRLFFVDKKQFLGMRLNALNIIMAEGFKRIS